MPWDDCRIFLALIEEGSLSAAARRLRLSHPTVRARLEQLEAQLGTVLFTRSVQGLAPTATALELREPARAMAIGAERFLRAGAAVPGEVAGPVRLSVSEAMGIEVMPPILARLRRAHPRLLVELVLSNRPADLLSQEVEVALRNVAPAEGAIVARRLTPIPLAFFAAQDYLARRGVPRVLADLAAHDIIGPDRNATDLAIAAGFGDAVWPARAALRTDSHVAQLAAARAGMGIAVAQLPLGLADPRLVRVLPDLQAGELPVWVVTHDNLRAVPRVRAVIDALVAAFTAPAGGGTGQPAE